jgi:sialic acid synthase SpsE
LREAERGAKEAVRRSIVAARDLKAGVVLTAEDITWLRPAGGLEPGREGEVLGRTLTKSMPAGTMIRLEDLA